MTLGQKIILTIGIIYWILAGAYSMILSDGYGAETSLINLIKTGLYGTVPLAIIWYWISPKKD